MNYGLAPGAAVKMFLVPICVQRKKIRSVLSKMEDQGRMLLNVRPGCHGDTETVLAVLGFVTGSLTCPQASYVRLGLLGYLLLAPCFSMNLWHTQIPS